MFPWAAALPQENVVPEHSTEELVTNTLMLELGAMVKRTERVRLERAAENRGRRHSNCADYSWLAAPPVAQPFELTAQELLELHDLCVKIPPPECGQCISRFRQVVTESEPEVQEVPGLFRMVLLGCVEGLKSEEGAKVRNDKQRSKSLTLMRLRSKASLKAKFQTGP